MVEITFPKVTICPPKNTFTYLNYDLMKSKNVFFSDEVKNKIINHVIDILQETHYNEALWGIEKIVGAPKN